MADRSQAGRSQQRILRKEFMMDRVDSTTGRRVAARGALRLSKLLPLMFVACLVRAESGRGATVSCPPDEKTKFVCGVVNSEDIVQLPKTHWVISSGKTGPGGPVGHLYLINANTRTVEPFYPVAQNQYRQDQKLFGRLPGHP